MLAEHGPGLKRLAKARLRGDVVALRVLRDIESVLRAHVPNGRAIVLTLGAPIKVPQEVGRRADEPAAGLNRRKSEETGAGELCRRSLADSAYDDWTAGVKTYRRAYSYLAPAHNFRKILLVFKGGRVEALAEI